MTIKELRLKPIGWSETRSFTMQHYDSECKEYYSLGKREDGKYFVGFSDDGSYCSSIVSEKYMIELINDENLSAQEALEIYMQSPQLSCWMWD